MEWLKFTLEHLKNNNIIILAKMTYQRYHSPNLNGGKYYVRNNYWNKRE